MSPRIQREREVAVPPSPSGSRAREDRRAQRAGWEQSRATWDHDWFKSYRLLLEALINTTRDAVDDPSSDFLEAVIEWQRQAPQLRSLGRAFPTEMGPHRLFLVGVLANCPPETRDWLEPLAQALWERRVGAEQLQQRLKAALTAADAWCAALESAVSAPTRVRRTISLGLEGMLQAFLEVGRALSAFPPRCGHSFETAAEPNDADTWPTVLEPGANPR